MNLKKRRYHLGAEDKAIELEYQLFVQLREEVKKYTERLQQQAKIISELDCLQSFAEIAQNIIILGLHLVKIKH